MPDLTRWWPLTGHDDLRLRLEAAYGAPERGYHDLRHLTEVLERLEELAGDAPFDRTEVLLAAWFHDSVYDGDRDAEERSARWAATALEGTGVRVDEVVRLVLLTQGHDPEPGDHNGHALCDADLAVLAAGPERYAEYVAGVRAEYAHLDEAVFAAGRAAVLEALASRGPLFGTRHGRRHWEEPARANLTAELLSLRAAGGDGAAPQPGAG